MDAILHLGGNPDRVNKTIEVALQNLTAKIIVSSEDNMQWLVEKFKNAGISKDRVIFNADALDTVGNFCWTYSIVRELGARKVYVVSDKFHMKRAMIIASIAYFYKGIESIPCPYMGGDLNRVESFGTIWASATKTLLWRITGKVFEANWLVSERGKYREGWKKEIANLNWD